MFRGRREELSQMEAMYQSKQFEFLVMYGRRRVGKTSLLNEFAKQHKAIFFSAQEKNDALNLADFSKTVQLFFEREVFGNFSDWETAFRFVGEHAKKRKIVLIIDEFPFIAAENPSIKSILQHVIDHSWQEMPIFLILCGSSVSFMENEVMGYKSPLYGRSTSRLEVLPFDYYDSAQFFEHYSDSDKLLAYGILGGIPCYLKQFDDRNSLEENIAEKIIKTGAFLKDEPQLLLKMELREPSVYNSIFEVIAKGASRLNDISTQTHEESQKCAKYIETLRTLRLVERITPCGEGETSRRSIYRIADNFFRFWFGTLFTDRSYFELLGEHAAAAEIMENMSAYMGGVFEEICRQYMVRLAKKGRLPFVPYSMGRWWGGNPMTKKQDDIDILALSKSGDKGIFCECKWRGELFDLGEYEDLLCASRIFTQVKERHYYLFSKSGFTSAVKSRAKQDGTVLVGIKDLFKA